MIDAAQIAADLATAEREHKQLAPFTDTYPDLDLGRAYDAQWAGVRARLDAGERLVGAKLGLTSNAKRRVMNVDEPLYGWVTSSMLGSYNEPLDLARFIHPRVEPEIAFLIGREIPAPATVTSVLAATEALFAAIDVLDSRYTDFRFKLPDVVADNASAALFLLGPQAVKPSDIDDVKLIGCVLRVGGDVVATAAGAASMGHPAAAVAWLVNQLAKRDQRLEPGMLVFSGGLTEPVPMKPGVPVTAEFDALGAVEIYTGR